MAASLAPLHENPDWRYLGNEKSYYRSNVVETTGFVKAFQIPAVVTRSEHLNGTKELNNKLFVSLLRWQHHVPGTIVFIIWRLKNTGVSSKKMLVKGERVEKEEVVERELEDEA